MYYENVINEEPNDTYIISIIILLYKFDQTWDALTF